MNATKASNGTARFAIYYSPQDTAAVYQAGISWLGRDAATGATYSPLLSRRISQEAWQRATESPRRYGFHATLKPPFRLADGVTLQELQVALRNLAARRRSFVAPKLVVRKLGHFLALILAEPSDSFSALAADCVRDLDQFRAPASGEELARRRSDSLCPHELEYLERWGYPYVFDTWKFHMSLTCSQDSETSQIFADHLKRLFVDPCKEPLAVDSICLFEEPAPGAHFRLVERIAFAKP